MANKHPYIIHLAHIRWTIHRGGHRTNHTHWQHCEAPKKGEGSDKPPGKLNPNRNAKFTFCFSRGEFGVFRHGLFPFARDHISGVGCRSPPNQSF